MTILDGTSLATHRAPVIARRAADVRKRRGRAPVLLLMAFADAQGRVPHVQGKLRAGGAAGLDVIPLIIAAGSSTGDAVNALREAIRTSAPDAVFVQVPFPADVDGDAVAGAIPATVDVDVMSPARVDAYTSDPNQSPPVTVSAALLLLDAHGIGIAGRSGVVVAEETPFSMMFNEALARRGAVMEPLVEPSDTALQARLQRADLVVAAAGRPGVLNTGMFMSGAIALDIGYFNAGGRGDIDVSAGAEHLQAIMPVPGGVGPMTVSALLERVVAFSGG